MFVFSSKIFPNFARIELSQLWYSLRDKREGGEGGLYWEAIPASGLRIASWGQLGRNGGDKTTRVLVRKETMKQIQSIVKVDWTYSWGESAKYTKCKISNKKSCVALCERRCSSLMQPASFLFPPS